ncbi:unnamed protein product [Linum trigynum]|uniref:Uncharacterized protein n=1 Tax=Linum trigynum TaxID=586398 RepID=A0AAV2D065_9ROSI
MLSQISSINRTSNATRQKLAVEIVLQLSSLLHPPYSQSCLPLPLNPQLLYPRPPLTTHRRFPFLLELNLRTVTTQRPPYRSTVVTFPNLDFRVFVPHHSLSSSAIPSLLLPSTGFGVAALCSFQLGLRDTWGFVTIGLPLG